MIYCLFSTENSSADVYFKRFGISKFNSIQSIFIEQTTVKRLFGIDFNLQNMYFWGIVTQNMMAKIYCVIAPKQKILFKIKELLSGVPGFQNFPYLKKLISSNRILKGYPTKSIQKCWYSRTYRYRITFNLDLAVTIFIHRRKN